MRAAMCLTLFSAAALSSTLGVCTVAIAASAAGNEPPAAPTAPASLSPQDRVAAWREDLHTLVTELPAKHKNAFSHISRERFEAAAHDLEARLDQLTDWQTYIELRRLVAMIGDAHTLVLDSAGRFRQRAYPMALGWFSDGLFVCGTTPDHRDLLAQRLVMVGDTPVEQVVPRLAELVAFENEPWMQYQVRQLIAVPELLTNLGLIADPEHASFTFADAAGTRTVVELAPLAPGVPITAVKPDETKEDLAFTRRSRADWYSCAMLPGSTDLYIWYDRCQDQPGKPTIAQFAQTAMDTLEREKPSRVIIDLRRNSGGNSALLTPLIVSLATHEVGHTPGKLFILIGRATFSSGMMNALQLKKATKGVLVGGPTGQKPNSYGEVKSFPLSRTGLTVNYSTKYFRQIYDADPPSLMPDVAAEPTSADFFSTRDVVIEAVRTYVPAP